MSVPADPEYPRPQGRPFSELSDTGLLWLINRVVFHPRGFALGITHAPNSQGIEEATGWSLLGDGSEVWVMGDDVDEDALLAKVREMLGP
jgi:hypothetical protein